MVFDHELLFSIKACQFGFYLTLLPYLQHRVAVVVAQAQELLEHQISMAQELAKYLGESTARGEELVRKLMELDEADDKERRDL